MIERPGNPHSWKPAHIGVIGARKIPDYGIFVSPDGWLDYSAYRCEVCRTWWASATSLECRREDRDLPHYDPGGVSSSHPWVSKEWIGKVRALLIEVGVDPESEIVKTYQRLLEDPEFYRKMSGL